MIGPYVGEIDRAEERIAPDRFNGRALGRVEFLNTVSDYVKSLEDNGEALT